MSRRTIVTPFALGLVFVLSCASAFDRAACADGQCASALTPVLATAGACGPGLDAPRDEAAGTSCPAECDRCDGDVCQIECSADSTCARETVACPPGMNCEVQCLGDAACKSATIEGPKGFALEIDCDGRSACGGAVVNAGRDVELTCRGTEACGSTTMHCGTGGCDWACVTKASCNGIAVD